MPVAVVSSDCSLSTTLPSILTHSSCESTAGSDSPSPSVFDPVPGTDMRLRVVLLLGTEWANPDVLRNTVKPSVIALLVVRLHDEFEHGTRECRSVFIFRALRELRAVGIVSEDDSKNRMGNGNMQEPLKGTTESFVCTDSCEPTVSAESVVRAFACASLRSVACIPSLDRRYVMYVVERPAVVFPPLGGSLVLPPYTSVANFAVHDLKEWEIECIQGDQQNGAGDHGQAGNPALLKAVDQLPLLYHTDGKNPFGIPAPHDWRTLWAAWDMVTLGMIPQEMLLQKPIDLRHKCLFYIGHIPTFLDMLLSRAIGEEATEPRHFWNIFERGIDPHVDDPQTCHHSHSDVPEADEDWPTLSSVLAFRDSVRARLMRVYDELISGKRTISRTLARTLVMVFEHEGFHVETLLYMLNQRAGAGTVPPPGFTSPPWTLLASQWSAATLPSTPHAVLGPCDIILGHDDSEADDPAGKIDGHFFGWDNESPRRVVQVGRFKVEWRPISNAELLDFLVTDEGCMKRRFPKSWVMEQGTIKVRTVYGPVSFDIARHWPVMASYDDLAAYAHFKGGRLPSEPELRLFLDTYEVGYDGGANIGFRNWHPVPATTGLEENGGRGSNGGVWEWTSTIFDGHEGLAPTKLFPGYSSDFFDGKHQVVLGASHATIPRLAGRRTLRNFYQHNYPYAWVGARVAYDL